VPDLRIADDHPGLHHVSRLHLGLEARSDRLQVELPIGDLGAHQLEAVLHQDRQGDRGQVVVVEHAVAVREDRPGVPVEGADQAASVAG